MRELLGLTTDTNPYVYLSDGGHFENLGLWSMVVRRCGIIIVSDAGCDPDYTFADLSNALRRIRIDLGIPIDFGEMNMSKAGQGDGNAHAVLGTIRYSAVDGPGAPDGLLLYVKATLSGDESVDIRNFAALHPAFPHDPTGNQFFDEDRFESYRALGYHSVMSVAGELELADAWDLSAASARKTRADGSTSATLRAPAFHTTRPATSSSTRIGSRAIARWAITASCRSPGSWNWRTRRISAQPPPGRSGRKALLRVRDRVPTGCEGVIRMTFVAKDLDPSGLERTSPTEAADIDEIKRGMLAIQAQAAAAGQRPLARGTHAKGICVRAELEVLDVRQSTGDPTLADRLACGIFSRPGIYPAIVRFANADGGHRRDRVSDVRAMSFSIDVPPGLVPGATRLDFSMNSRSTFPINDAHAFAVSVRVLSAAGMRAKWKALRSLTWSEFRSLLRVIRLGRQQTKGTPRKPYQQLRFWSTVPFLHGGRDAIKYSAIPADNPARPLQAGPNRLQDELVRHVNEDGQMSEFAFALQLLEPGRMTHEGQTQEASFWVENAAVEWNERESPFHVVGRLRLLPKSVLPPAQSETFSIDVTEHSTPDSRPIGSINRARWHAESASRAARLAQPVVASPWTPDRPVRRLAWTAIAVAALVFFAALAWAIWPVTKDLPVGRPAGVSTAPDGPQRSDRR